MQGRASSHIALVSLYLGHRPWLVERLRYRLRNHADAEDLASETFLQVAASGQAETIAEPRAYLSTIARRLLFHFWRKRELERAYLDWLALQAEEAAASPEARVLAVEALAQLDRMLAGLRPPVRAVFLYSQLDGLGYEEIGRRMNLSVRTVGRYMAQALERCQRVHGQDAK